jgi:hypothetical protein
MDQTARRPLIDIINHCIPMHDQDTIQKFIALRAEGKSFAVIGEALNVSKPTLIGWSRAHQFEINNLKTIHEEAMQKECFAGACERWKSLGSQLRRVEEELAKRSLEDVSTARLIVLSAGLRAEASREESRLHFTEAVEQIPQNEPQPEAVLDWRA